MNDPDIRQAEQCPAAVQEEERRDTFRQIPWSLKDCCVALGGIAIIYAALRVLSLMDRSVFVYSVGGVLWVSMFGWMVVFPLWIARSKGVLRRPALCRVLKEFGVAIPLALCLILVQSFVVVVLTNMAGGPVEVGSALSGLRNAPNDARLYLLLIPMFTLGPVAEELFFRGMLYNALRQQIAPLAAVMLQALVFALVHYGCPETSIVYLVAIFVSGVVLAVVYEWRKTLWSPIALHALKNFVFAGPVIALMILNSHTPAKTWLEASRPPDWLEADFTGIERQATGEEQRLYAIDTWGSRGLRMWKKELRGFQAVCEWFPNDREACAEARVGIATIYQYYLRDLRRAVVESDQILSVFRDQPEACVQALMTRGWSYYELGDYPESRQAFQEIVGSYPSYEWALESALEGLRVLDSER
jgi:membrane protease YdiL (CAAX protease family)